MRSGVHTCSPHFFAIDAPAFDAVARCRHGACIHVRRVRSVLGLGEAERQAHRFLNEPRDQFGPLARRTEVSDRQHEGIIDDDGMLVLQVIVQAQALGGEMFPDNGHPQIAAVLAAVFRRQCEAQMAGIVGAPAGFAQQRLHSTRGRPPFSKSVRAHSRR